jgi:hypothetical protein
MSSLSNFHSSSSLRLPRGRYSRHPSGRPVSADAPKGSFQYWRLAICFFLLPTHTFSSCLSSRYCLRHTTPTIVYRCIASHFNSIFNRLYWLSHSFNIPILRRPSLEACIMVSRADLIHTGNAHSAASSARQTLLLSRKSKTTSKNR